MNVWHVSHDSLKSVPIVPIDLRSATPHHITVSSYIQSISDVRIHDEEKQKTPTYSIHFSLPHRNKILKLESFRLNPMTSKKRRRPIKRNSKRRRSIKRIGTIFDADSLSKRRLRKAIRAVHGGAALLFVANDRNTLRKKKTQAIALGAAKRSVLTELVKKTPQAADNRICVWLSNKRHRFGRRPQLVTKDKLLRKRVRAILS